LQTQTKAGLHKGKSKVEELLGRGCIGSSKGLPAPREKVSQVSIKKKINFYRRNIWGGGGSGGSKTEKRNNTVRNSSHEGIAGTLAGGVTNASKFHFSTSRLNNEKTRGQGKKRPPTLPKKPSGKLSGETSPCYRLGKEARDLVSEKEDLVCIEGDPRQPDTKSALQP